MAGGALVDLYRIESYRGIGDVGVEDLGLVLICYSRAGHDGHHPRLDQLPNLRHLL